jgi:hypothetical protein
MSLMSHPALPLTPGADQGTTLIELIVAMTTSIIVIFALFAILEFSTNQEARITDRVQANQIGRAAMASVIERLHSSCTGFGATAIQAPGTTPVSPLKETGPTDLWFISAYGSSSSSNAVIEKVFEHDIHWESTGKSNTGETLGTLTDFSFESVKGSGPANKSGKWEFPELKEGVAGSSSRVLATNVIAPTISEKPTIFQYYKFAAPNSGELVPVAEKIPAAATADELAKVAVTFTQAPESKNTKKGYGMAPFYDAVVLRLNPTETSTETKNEPCA